MNCTNCGTQNPEGTKFCSTCGAPMAQNAAPAPGYAPNPAYAPNYASANGTSSLLKYIPIAGAVIAFISIFLDWITVSVSAFGYSESEGQSLWSIVKLMFENFGDLNGKDLFLLFAAIVAVAGIIATIVLSLRGNKMALVAAAAGAVAGLIFETTMKGDFEKIYEDMSDMISVSMSFGFFLFLIGMVAAAVCAFLNSKKQG